MKLYWCHSNLVDRRKSPNRQIKITAKYCTYMVTHTVHTRVLNVSFLYTPVRVPAGHRKTKYTSSSHQASANQKHMQL